MEGKTYLSEGFFGTNIVLLSVTLTVCIFSQYPFLFEFSSPVPYFKGGLKAIVRYTVI